MKVPVKNTWAGNVTALLAIYENASTNERRNDAEKHIRNMGNMADTGVEAIELIKELREEGRLTQSLENKMSIFMKEIGHSDIVLISDSLLSEVKEEAFDFFMKVPVEDKLETTVLHLRGQYPELAGVSFGAVEKMVFESLREGGAQQDCRILERLFPGEEQVEFVGGDFKNTTVREVRVEFVAHQNLDEINEGPRHGLDRCWKVSVHGDDDYIHVADCEGYASAQRLARVCSGLFDVPVCDTVRTDVERELRSFSRCEAYGAWVAKRFKEEGTSGVQVVHSMLNHWEELKVVSPVLRNWVINSSRSFLPLLDETLGNKLVEAYHEISPSRAEELFETKP